MLAEITSAITTIKTMSDIAGFFIRNKVDNATTEKAIELQSNILALQSLLLTIQTQNQELLQSKGALEKELIEIKNWNAESENYELHEIAAGSFVMASLSNENSSAPAHWLCVNCYQKRQKSVLQYESYPYQGMIYSCPNCKNTVIDHSKSYNPYGSF